MSAISVFVDDPFMQLYVGSFFVAFCLWPAAFAALAWIFAALCLVTTLGRVLMARDLFGGADGPQG